VTIPLTIFGGIAGKNSKTEFDAPCRCVRALAGLRGLASLLQEGRGCSVIIMGCHLHELP